MFRHLALGIAIVVVPLVPAQAQDFGLSVNPPPIPAATFAAGQSDLRVQGLFLHVGGDADFNGVGLFGSFRYAASELLAVDGQVGGNILVGDASQDSSSFNMHMDLGMIAANVELQPIHNERFSLILFAGANVGGFIGTSSLGDTTYSFFGGDGAPSGFLYGFQGGVQGGVQLGVWHLDPFVTVTRMMGTVSVGPVVSTADIEMTMVSPGIDVVYLPIGISLSSLLQVGSGAMTSNTFILQLGYNFDLSADVEGEPVDASM